MRLASALLSLCGMAMATAASAQQAPPTVHAIFVGIDKYAHSRQGDPRYGQFDDLNGAVGDVRRFKQTLRDNYGFDLDREAPGDCRSVNAVSITLTDSCATRDAIFRGMAAQIKAARPGETVLLYFAGHGTAQVETASRKQASGLNNTFVPHDARSRDVLVPDILDTDFAVFRSRANRAGVNFVLVIDSCHSGTIARDGTPPNPGVLTVVREIPARATLEMVPSPPTDENALASTYELPAARPGIAPGYWLSLAASDDNELAREFKGISPAKDAAVAGMLPDWVPGEPAGVFTTALIAAIRRNPRGTFGDFVEDARTRILELGITDQNPRADGEFHQQLGVARSGVLLFPAKAGPGGVLTVGSGSLSGLTEGSRFAIFAQESDALSGAAAPVATGKILRVRPYDADLVPDAQLLTKPGGWVVKEVEHSWGAQRITVGWRDAAAAADVSRLGAMLAPLGYASSAAPLQLTLNFVPGSRMVEMRDPGGAVIRRMGSFDAPEFGDELGKVLRLVLGSRMVLGLRTPDARYRPLLCLVAVAESANGCVPPGPSPNGVAVLKQGEFKAIVRNVDPAARYIYVLAVSPDGLKVIPVLPAPGALDRQVAGQDAVESDSFYFSKPGAWRFIAIASAGRINTAALEQKGLTDRDPAKCMDNASRVFCAAGAGRVDAGVAALPDWAASITTIKAGVK